MSYTSREYADMAARANSDNKILKVVEREKRDQSGKVERDEQGNPIFVKELLLEDSTTAEATYVDKRANEYLAVGEQLDIIYHDIENGNFGVKAKRSNFFKAITEIKNKYPKPVVMAESNMELSTELNTELNTESNTELNTKVNTVENVKVQDTTDLETSQ